MFIENPKLVKKRRQGTSLHQSKRNASSTAITDLKKSFGMLQAYGEYQRFLQVSKKFMKDRGISVGKLKQSQWGLSLSSKSGGAKRPKRRGSHNMGMEGAGKGRSIESRISRMRESRDSEEGTKMRNEVNEGSPEDERKYAEMNRLLEERLHLNQSEGYDNIENPDLML